jgi:hypothetical protein
VTGRFPILDQSGMQQYFTALPQDQRDKIMSSKLTIYICEGTETEVKQWFRTINIAGIPLNEQELLNAIYSGPFVTKAKEEFSNSQNSNNQKRSAYISGNVIRQDFLSVALEWASKGNVDAYMSQHRFDTDINHLKTYFDTVIDWISSVFIDVEDEMRGLEWGNLYEIYHNKSYDIRLIHNTVSNLYGDVFIKNKRGVFEYILGGCNDTKLLEIRVFDESIKQSKYRLQTQNANNKQESNCPLCSLGNDSNKTRIYKINEMDADHVTAWSKGGSTDISNCQMLCKTHNRAKGNK